MPRNTALKSRESETGGVGPLRAALYARVSTEEQAEEGYSLEGQVDKLRHFAAAKGWRVAKEYVDGGYTGRDTKRPAYREMMEGMESWDVLVVLKMDRIHRNSRNFIEMFDKIARRKREFVSMNESLDTSTAMGRFVMDIMQRIAQLESEQIGERTSFALRVKAGKGEQALGQQAPYGFRWTEGDPKHGTGTWVPIPEEAAAVVRIFEMAAKGEGRMRIAEILGWCTCQVHRVNYRHIKKDGTVSRYVYEHKRGNCTGCSRVWYILGNPAYVGYFNYRGQIARGSHDPLITRELFEAAQKNRRTVRPTLLPE